MVMVLMIIGLLIILKIIQLIRCLFLIDGEIKFGQPLIIIIPRIIGMGNKVMAIHCQTAPIFMYLKLMAALELKKAG